MMIYIIAGIITFITVFIKGFQYKNVIGGHMKMVAVTAYAMAFGDVLLIGIVAKNHWTIGIACGLGAMFGMLGSIKLHNFLFVGAKS